MERAPRWPAWGVHLFVCLLPGASVVDRVRRTGRIGIHEGDDPRVLAHNFATTYKLDPVLTERLEALIRQHMQVAPAMPPRLHPQTKRRGWLSMLFLMRAPFEFETFVGSGDEAWTWGFPEMRDRTQWFCLCHEGYEYGPRFSYISCSMGAKEGIRGAAAHLDD